MNDTLCTNGLVPSSLVFGEYPSVRILSDPVYPKEVLASRDEFEAAFRKEMSKVHGLCEGGSSAETRYSPSADRELYHGDKVLLFRENK